eukprot:NODE_6078_length_532_cov_174.248447_g5323_i0.p1 GENE.NODE_6078_length_532_cov_174.248447_g5323_i0~~NODE_6078_length_532_cov_174.248447_g5323_i0.p1  ORF type:complete len:128 (-),score=15.00 NODE_6078_length_532_cov_174.248447_g5323_i0:80-463(-)
MSWQTYVDSNLLGSGACTQGALLSIADGSVWATSAGFAISPEEGKNIVAGIKDPSKFQASGIVMGGQKYFATKADANLAYGKLGSGGCCLAGSAQAITIGVYGEGIPPPSCNKAVEDVRDYLAGVGY